jgi:hypothetical protein
MIKSKKDIHYFGTIPMVFNAEEIISALKKFLLSTKFPVPGDRKGDCGVGFSWGLVSLSTSSEKLCQRLKALGEVYISINSVVM